MGCGACSGRNTTRGRIVPIHPNQVKQQASQPETSAREQGSKLRDILRWRGRK
uniref:Uncharacterized protein n=1 Tax=Podoviridae sp. ctlpi2 TaxID=2826574 RepID=A0A8S5MLH6_9CAUD|nr:MAG TPA: hypothetical protein [Podoviridae sp. ctlpi2]